MTEVIAISIVALILGLVSFVSLDFLKAMNSKPKQDLHKIINNLESEVQWEKCGRTSASGYFNGYKISIALVPFNYVYCSFHITLYVNLKEQPIFMLSYPKLSENIEQRGNSLFASLPTMGNEQEKSTFKLVHETLKTMALLASKHEINA